MNVTLEEFLHAINIIGDDRDVYVDGIDSIAVCPPVKLTPCWPRTLQTGSQRNSRGGV